jgi:hypothetical protein
MIHAMKTFTYLIINKNAVDQNEQCHFINEIQNCHHKLASRCNMSH